MEKIHFSSWSLDSFLVGIQLNRNHRFKVWLNYLKQLIPKSKNWNLRKLLMAPASPGLFIQLTLIQHISTIGLTVAFSLGSSALAVLREASSGEDKHWILMAGMAHAAGTMVGANPHTHFGGHCLLFFVLSLPMQPSSSSLLAQPCWSRGSNPFLPHSYQHFASHLQRTLILLP